MSVQVRFLSWSHFHRLKNVLFYHMAIPFFLQLIAFDIEMGAIDLLYKKVDEMLEKEDFEACTGFIEDFIQTSENHELSPQLHVALLTITHVHREKLPNRMKLKSHTQRALSKKHNDNTVNRILWGL